MQRTDVSRGIAVEWLAVGWMVVEAVVAIEAGIRSGSIALVAFGADSVIELVSAAVLIWRLSVEAGSSDRARVERAERISSWTVGLALLALALYIVAAAVRSVVTRAAPTTAPLGIAVTAAASLFMPLLAGAKKRIGRKIGSAALVADGSCSMVCAYMSWIVLVDVAVSAIIGFWWIDSVAALALVYYVVHEALEAIESARTT